MLWNHALLTDSTSSTAALQKKSVPSGLVVLHAADLAAWSWRQCIIYEIIIRSVMMISNSLVVLDSGQMFWNQRCSERCVQWPNSYAEVSLPCRLSKQSHQADPVVVVGIPWELHWDPHPPARLLSSPHSQGAPPKCHLECSQSWGKSPPGGTGY